MLRKRVWIWSNAVHNGRRDVADKQRPCGPSTTPTDENVYRADSLIGEDRCIKLADVCGLDIALGNAHRIVHDKCLCHMFSLSHSLDTLR